MCRELCNDLRTVAMHAGLPPEGLPDELRGFHRRRLLLELHRTNRIRLQDGTGIAHDPTALEGWADSRSLPDEAVFVATPDTGVIEQAIRERIAVIRAAPRPTLGRPPNWVEDRLRRAEERRRRVAELKAAGRWHHPLFKTLKEARAAGYDDFKPDEYGGEQIEIKGHSLVRGPKKAVSRTAWERMGYRVRPGEKPHAYSTGYHSRWAVYREDQVVALPPKKRRVIKPAQQVGLLAALWAINRQAKRLRDRAAWYYEEGRHALASANSQGKNRLYRIKGQALHHLLAEGAVAVVGYHRFGGGNWAEVLKGGGYTFHRPCTPRDDEGPVNLLDDIEAKPRSSKEPRLRDALYTLERYLDDKEHVDVYEWPPKVRYWRWARDEWDDEDEFFDEDEGDDQDWD